MSISASKVIHLGGAASGIKLAPIAHGLMGMHWVPHAVPDEQCFEAIKAGIDALPEGTKAFLNSGEFYSQDLSPANLEMVSRFFEKYPSYADKAFLSVKGGTQARSLVPDGSPENLRRSVEDSLKALRGKKKIDLFEAARVDKKVGVEKIVETLAGFVKEGLFDYIGVSECSAETLRKAAKVAPIAIVEIEVSLWSYEEETKKVIAAAEELGVAVAGYSPVGRGFLTGNLKSRSDLKEGDHRLHFTRFSEANFDYNLRSVEAVKKLAEKKGVTPAQVAIAWVRSLGPHVIPLAGSSKKERTLENLRAADVELTKEELDELKAIQEKFGVKGGRYNDNVSAEALHLWG